MDYIAIRFSFDARPADSNMLTALLSEMGYEGFEELQDGLKAFIPQKDFSEKDLQNLLTQYFPSLHIQYQCEKIGEQNWNALWEQNFEPVFIAGKCFVRASFHKKKADAAYEIVIEPKMSFGTAHHETTALMMEYLLEHEPDGKSVLDMGSGTGILAILASMRGAREVDAIDNDEWAYKNCRENVRQNNIHNISVILGDAKCLGEKKYHIILANINRNILLHDMQYYTQALKEGGSIFFSGFYEKDLQAIQGQALKRHLQFVDKKQKNNWVAAHFIKVCV